MTTIPRRCIAGTNLTQIALLYRAIDGIWRYRRRDRNMPITPTRASRILALAARVPGARVDPADVRAVREDASLALARRIMDKHDRVLRALAEERDSLDGDETTS
jgi:hypothetical protein